MAYLHENGDRTFFTPGASFIHNGIRVTIKEIDPDADQEYLAQAELINDQ